MPKQFVKPNSHAQAEGRRFLQNSKGILELTGLTKDEWLAMLFELGCQACEEIVANPTLVYPELTDPARGWWAYWIALWLKDDAAILSQCPAGARFDAAFYQAHKESFIVNDHQSTILAV